MAQALAICAFRAAELRRAFLLVSNNGVTALIGPDGRVRQATRADELAYLIAEAPLCDSISPFAIVGEWGAWGVGAVAAGWLVVASRLRRPKGP